MDEGDELGPEFGDCILRLLSCRDDIGLSDPRELRPRAPRDPGWPPGPFGEPTPNPVRVGVTFTLRLMVCPSTRCLGIELNYLLLLVPLLLNIYCCSSESAKGNWRLETVTIGDWFFRTSFGAGFSSPKSRGSSGWLIPDRNMICLPSQRMTISNLQNKRQHLGIVI